MAGRLPPGGRSRRHGAYARPAPGRTSGVTVHIGTSGWQYAHWRGRLYPERLPQRLWLEDYAEHFSCVEVNATFYG
jgi:hypothetical protein